VSHDAYIRRETMVSAVINAILSALFFWLVFRGVDPVPVWGMGNWVFDFVPQGFMIALMSTLVPGALTGRAIRSGRIAADGQANRLPGNLLARALLLAGAAAILGAGLVAAIMKLVGAEQLPPGTALLLKIVYGASLAILVTPPGLRRALAAEN